MTPKPHNRVPVGSILAVIRTRVLLAVSPVFSYTRTRIHLRNRARVLVTLALGLVVLTTASLNVFSPLKTAAATSNTINFQARLMTGVGSIVPDGSYNVEFKLYNVSSGGSAQWTEDYLNNASQGISVANGYLTANLGSLVAFPTTINWDQQEWLTMTVRGTGSCAFGSCTPTDAEMSPRLLLTAVPYAFKAGQLAQFNATSGFTSTLSLVQPTVGNQIFQIQDQAAAGTYNLCIQNTSACGFATGSGAAFVQGGNTFSGSTAGDLGTNNNGVLNLRTNGGTRVTVGTSGDLTFAASNTITTSLTNGNLTLQANGSGTATLDTGASGTVAVGVSANNKTINIGNVTNGNANTTTVSIATSTGAAQTINIGGNATSGGSNAGTTVKVQGGATALSVANGGTTLQTFTNSTTALQVQNAAGAPVLLVDTTSSDNSGATLNYLTYPGFESGSFTSGASGWVKTGATQVALAQNANKLHAYNGLFSVNVTTTATIGDGLQTSSFNATPAANAYIVSFYAKVSSGTMASNLFTVTATDGATNPTCSPAAGITLNASGFQRLFCSVTTGGNLTNLKIAQNDATARTIYVDAVQLQTNDFNGGTNNIAAPTPYTIGAIQLRGIITNPLALINNADSTAAFQIQNTSGTSNTFVADTLNNKITIGSLNSAGIVTNTSGGVLGTVTTIPIANGGTNAASFSATNGVTYFDGTKLTVTAASTGAQCLITTSSGVAPTWGSCGTGTALTLQNTYDNSSSPATITSSSAAKTITLQSGATFNTTRFFEVAANGVAAPVLSVDTANQRVGVDLNNPAFALDVVGDINASLTLKVAGTTVCDNTGCSASPGGGNYIRNATAQQTNANYNIKSGVAGQTTAQITGSNSATVPVAIISSGTTPGAAADLLQLTDGTNVLAKFANTGVLTLGRAGAGTTGAIVLNNGTNANAVTLTTGTTSGSYNLVLPASAGNSGDCLKNGGVGGTLTFAACGSTGITTTLQNAYDNSSSPATITTSSGSKGVGIIAGAVPTADLLNITNSGQPITANGVNGLSIGYFTAITSGANEDAAFRIDQTLTGTTAGTTNGVRFVASATGPATTVTDNGVKLEGPATTGGAGTYNAINIANIGTVASGGTVRGLNITATNSQTAGTIRGIQLNNLTAGAASEIGIDLGTGWDNLLTYNNGATTIINGTGQLNLGTVTGTLAVGNGGTGAASFTTNGILYGNNTGALQVTAASTGANQCLITASSGGVPSWAACPGGSGGTLQGAYTASTGGTTPEIIADSTRNGVDIQDANTTLGAGTTLLAVRASATSSTLGTLEFGATNNGNVTYLGTLTGGSTGQFTVGNTGNIVTSGTYNTNTFTGSNLTFGTAGAASIAAASGQNLSIDAGTAGTLNLGTSANNKTVNIGATGATNNTTAVNIANTTSSGGASTIQIGGTGATSGSNTASTVVLQGGQVMEKITNTGAIIQTFTNSSTAFQVQNASGAPIFLVDTSTTSNLVTNPGFEVNTTTGWSYTNATGTQNLTKSNTYHGQASNSVNVTVAGGGANVTGFTASITPAQYTFSFYAMKGTNAGTLSVAITGGSAPACTLINYVAPVTTGFNRYICTFTSTTTNVTQISINSNNTGTFFLDGVELNTGATAVPYAAQGAVQIRGTINNPLTLQNTADSTSAFQIQNAAGTSNLLVADTLNGKVSVGGTLTVSGAVTLSNLATNGVVTVSGGVLSSSTLLPIANGGTNNSSAGYSTNGALYYDGSKFVSTATGGAGTLCLSSVSGAAPTWATCGSGSSTTLQNAYTNSAGATPSILLTNAFGGISVRDGTTPVAGNLFSLQNNGGTATYFGISATGLTMQNASGVNALAFDNTTKTLKVFDASGGTNFASITYSSSTATFAANTGTTQIGNGTGNVTSNLTGANDTFQFTKTYSPGASNYTLQDYQIGRTLTSTTGTQGGALLQIKDTSTANAGIAINPTLLLINQASTVGTISGNLIDAQLAGTSKFKVDTTGLITGIGGINVSGAASSINASSNFATNINTGSSTGAVTIGNASAGTLTLQGNASTTLKATSGANTTTVGFVSPTANNAINFPNAAGTVAVSATGNIALSAAGQISFTGTLGVGSGGTGSTSFSATNGVIYYNGTSLVNTAASTGAQCLQTAGSGTAPIWGACGSGVSTLQAAYNGSTNPEIVVNSTNGALTVRDNATPIGANLLEVQNNAGTATFFGASATGILLQNASGQSALQFDNSTNTLKVFGTSGSANYASITYDTTNSQAVFAASSGNTVVGSGSGNVQIPLTGTNDIFTFTKTVTTGNVAYNNANPEFGVTRAITAGTASVQGTLFKVQDSSTGSSVAGDLLTINQNNATATGNLIRAQQNGTDRLVVTAAGRVGIGTNSPASLLANTASNITDNGGTGLNASSIGWSINGTGFGLAIQNASSATTSDGLLVKTAATDTGSYIARFQSNGTARLDIRADGNVGINTTNPQATFDLESASTGTAAILAQTNGSGGDVVHVINSGTGSGTPSVTLSGGSITTGSASVLTATSGGNVSDATTDAKLDSSRFVTVHMSGSCFGTLIAEIGQYVGSTVAYGSPTTLNGSVCIGNGGTNFAVSALDSSHFVVVYYNSNGTLAITALVCTVTGTTIPTCGAVTNLATNVGGYAAVAVTTLDSTHFVASYYDITGTATKTAAASVSGTTITWGTPVNATSGSSSFTKITTLDSTHFVMGYSTASGPSAIAGSVSGTTITLGSAVQVNSSGSTLMDVEDLTSTTFAIAYSATNNSNATYALTGSVSGTTITLNSQQLVSSSVPQSNQGMSLVALSSTSLVVTYSTSTTNITNIPLSLSGTTFIIGTAASNTVSTITNFVSTAALTSTTFVVDYGTSSSVANSFIGTVNGSVTTATSSTSITLGSTSVLTATSGGNVSDATTVAKIDSSRFVAVHFSGSCFGSMIGEIGQYVGNSVTYGSPTTIINSACNGAFAVSVLDSTHFVVAAGDSNAHTMGAEVCTITAATIPTCGALTNLASNAGGYNAVAITTMDSTHFVASYYDVTGVATKTAAASVSGTTITWGAAVSAAAVTSTFTKATTMDSTHFVMAYATSSSSSVIAGSLSGTTITLGSAVQVNASNTSLIDVQSLTSTTFAAAYSATNNSSAIYALTGSLSGTTITLNNQQLVSTTSPTTADGMSLIDLSSTSLVLTYGFGGTNTIAHLPLSLSGTTFTVGSVATFVVNTQNYVSTAPLSSTTFIVDYGTSTSAASSYIATVGFGGTSSSIAATTVAGQAVTVTNAGESVFRSSGVSNFAFQIQDASGNALFTLDTANNLIVAQDSSGVNVLTIDLTNHRVGIGTTTPGTALSVNGGNNINPSWPDGTVGTLVSTSVNNSTTTYTVPSGKTLYITSCLASGSVYIINNANSNILYYCNYTSIANMPVPVAAGTVISTLGAGTAYFTGLLVNIGVTPVLTLVNSLSTTYTVPSGKTFYITGCLNQSTTNYVYNSVTNNWLAPCLISGGYGMTPIPVAGGTTIGAGFSASFYLTGYLTNSNGLGG